MTDPGMVRESTTMIGRAYGACTHRHAMVPTALLLSWLVGVAGCGTRSRSGAPLPVTLGDREFWDLSIGLSEPPGTFDHSDNLVSNEPFFVHTVRLLRPTGGVYIGVGPEQNYSYIAKLRPSMTFIIDVRTENRNLHLMYKALFELSADRADFLSRLFSRERPAGVGPKTSIQELFEHYGSVSPDRRLQKANFRLIRERLVDVHRFPLSAADQNWIEYALEAFYSDGPDIHYGRSRPNDSPGPSYRLLMTESDVSGQSRSFLATEEGFAFVKDLHARNMIVPVVGNFAGADAIRLVGDYVRAHDEVVRAFYGSNVEVYLNRQQAAAYCRNLAGLPHSPRTWFIGGKGMQSFSSKLRSCGRGAR